VSSTRQRRGSSRKAKIAWSLVGTIAGTLVLGAFAAWQIRLRDTDLGDPEAGVTRREREVIADVPAIEFRDVGSERGINMAHGPGPRGRTLPEDTGSGIAWGDVDGDGDLDLYVVNFPGTWGARPEPGGHNRLYRNDGGTFVEVSESAGVSDPDGFGMGAYFADYDGDGHTDLYVTNVGPNRLFRNRGDGTFEDVADTVGVAGTADGWSTGAAWADFNKDGRLDLFVVNYVAYDDGGFEPDQLGHSAGGEAVIPFTLNPNSFDPQPDWLFLANEMGGFDEVGSAMGVDDPHGRGLGAAVVDFDGDAWLDLYVSNDVSTNRLYRNLGGEGTSGFQDLSMLTGTADPRGSMGLSVADLGDASGGPPDGLPDIFITHWVAQENAFYFALPPGGGGAWEYRDRIRELRLGEASTDVVGWGSALVDLDLDGRLDLVVANGSTLEVPDDPTRLQPETMFFMWNDGQRFHPVPTADDDAIARPIVGRGIAVADYDMDGDVDVAVSVNRGRPLLLENVSELGHASVVVTLEGPEAVVRGAAVEIAVDGFEHTRWWGADAGYLGTHASEMVVGLGASGVAQRIAVSWVDGTRASYESVPAGRVKLMRDGSVQVLESSVRGDG